MINMTKLELYREELLNESIINPGKINDLINEFEKERNILLPNESSEILSIVNNLGEDIGVKAPRWLCHLLGLRHKSAHILIFYYSNIRTKNFIFQVRNWNKNDCPGYLEVSASGHSGVIIDNNSIESAYKELDEELGLSSRDLVNEKLIYYKGYEFIGSGTQENFYNKEWCDLYYGELRFDSFKKISFKDREVVGLYVCPENEVSNFINQNIIPSTRSLKNALEFFLQLHSGIY